MFEFTVGSLLNIALILGAVVEGKQGAVLELHDPLDQERITIAGRNPVLAANFSAPVSFVVAVSRPDKLGLIRLLNPQNIPLHPPAFGRMLTQRRQRRHPHLGFRIPGRRT